MEPLVFGLGAFGIIFVLSFVLVICTFLFVIVRGVTQSASNDQQPVLSAPARVVAKRTRTSGGGDSMVSTWYDVTFELPGGERREFGVGGRDYGLLA